MSSEKTKMPLKAIMTINGAIGLLWELIVNYHYSQDDGDRIMRCIKDLENLNLILQKPDNVSNNVAKPDLQHLQAENNRLKKVLKNIIKWAPACYNTDECPLKNGDGFDNGCGYNCAYFLAHEALNGESEGK